MTNSPKARSTDAALLRRTITQNLSEDEHALFVLAAERSGLDPFARQIYFMRDGGKFTIQATIDGLRISAERTGKYSGQLGPEWCGTDGVWRDIWTEKAPPVAARVGILRTDFAEPVWGKALYSEFRPSNDDFWLKMPASQLAKCAEALGFRKAFPREFSGIYTPDEMAQATSGSLGVATLRSTAPPRSACARGDSPDQGGGVKLDPAASLPLVVRSFTVNGTVGNRDNVKHAFEFFRQELERVLGLEGTAEFKRIYARLPRVFKTREACSRATIDCWVQMWAIVQAAAAKPEAA